MLVDLRLQARGVRETARALPLGPNPVRRARRQHAPGREAVHPAVRRPLHSPEVAWHLERAGEAEAARDERWACGGHQGPPRGLWQALAHHTGTVLAYVGDRRTDDVFWPRNTLLAPWGLPRCYPEPWRAAPRQLAPAVPGPGQGHTQIIARQPLPVRTRLKRLGRKPIGLAKTLPMHDIVMGLVVKRSACGRAV